MWIQHERPRLMQFQSLRGNKGVKCAFPNALNTEHDKYVQSVNRKIDESAQLDLRFFQRLDQQKRPSSSRVYREFCNQITNQTEPNGVAVGFADLYEDITIFQDENCMHILRRIFPLRRHGRPIYGIGHVIRLLYSLYQKILKKIQSHSNDFYDINLFLEGIKDERMNE